MPSGRRFTWVPPQRDPKESARHYIAELERTMRHLKLIWDNEHNSRELRQKNRNRYDECVTLRDEAAMPRGKQ